MKLIQAKSDEEVHQARLLFEEYRTQDGNYASRVYVIAERVEFLASRKASNGQASPEASPEQPATDGEARGAQAA